MGSLNSKNNTAAGINGGAIYSINSISLIIRDSIFTNNTASNGGIGGALYLTVANTIISNCKFSGNQSGYNGGAGMIEGVLTIENSTFENNTASLQGGALRLNEYCPNKVTITDCTFTGNQTGSSGGGAIKCGCADITNCIFRENKSVSARVEDTSVGGALHMYTGNISKCLFENNRSESPGNATGGALYYDNWINMSDLLFINNTSWCGGDKWSPGGAVYSDHYWGDSTGNMTNCIFINNTGKYGDAIYSEKLNMNSCLVYHNTGTAVSIKGGTITKSTIVNNKDGDGLYVNGTPTLTISGSNIYGHYFHLGSLYRYDLRNTTASKITATGNYWGTAAPTDILEHIFDYYDDNTKGEVNFGIENSEFLTQSAPDAPALPDKIVVSPKANDFGKSSIGAKTRQTFGVANAGDANLNITGVSKKGGDESEFTIENNTCAGKSLAPNELCTFDVVFARSAVGVKNSAVEITSNDAKSPALNIPLTGTALSQLPGDVDNNGTVELKDAVLSFQILDSITPASPVYLEADVNGDKKIGLEEGLFVEQKVVEQRTP